MDGEALKPSFQKSEPLPNGRKLIFTIPGGELTETLEIKEGALIRQGMVRRTEEGPSWKLEFFDLPLARLGEEGGKVTAPGPFWGWTYIRPSLPIASLPAKPISPHSTPDGSFGFIAVEGVDQTSFLWMDTLGETSASPTLAKDGGRLSVQFRDVRSQWLAAGASVHSSRMILSSAPTLNEALKTGRRWIALRYPPANDTPAWVKDAVVLEVMLENLGSFSALEEKLQEYASAGVNTLYLMPHWPGGYMPLDLEGTDPRFGSREDLKRLVAKAKRLKMRVLFDLVIHGVSPESRWAKEEPSYFIRTPEGGIALHPTWKSASTDWTSPTYLRAMADLARGHAKEFGIDGYRVDAAGFKGPGWHESDGQGGVRPSLNPPAYRRGAAAPEVMRAMLQALREVNPEAVLLSEVFGPVFPEVCSFLHDNQCEAVPWLLQEMEQGRLDGEDYRRHVHDTLALLSPEVTRVYYSRNHDTSWFGKFYGYSPSFWAAEAVHGLCANISIFAGDPNHGPHPDAEVFARYKSLLDLRTSFAGPLDLSHPSGSRQVFMASRGGKKLLVNFSPKPAALALEGEFCDVYSGQNARREGELLHLDPFQALLQKT